MIWNLYPNALDCGISPEQFWGLTIAENEDLIESYSRRKLREAKQDLLNKHFLARDIGQFAALAIYGSDKVEIMELWDFFPELFAEEGKAAEERKRERQLEVYKEQMKDYAYRHNHRNGGGK